MIVEVKFDTFNWWSLPIYRTESNIPIVKLEEGFYSLSDPNDIDSEPYNKLKDSCIKIVKDYEKR